MSTSENEPVARGASREKDIERLLRIDLAVIAVLAEKQMKLGEVLRLAAGSVIEFDKSTREPLELMANDRRVGRGVAVKAGDHFAVRVADIGSPGQTLRKLAGEDDSRKPA